jgi:hypothetical protein
VSFNNSTKVLTITGTRTQVNSRLSAISYLGASDYFTDFVMFYTVVTPRGSSATQTKFQQFVGTNTDEVSNVNISRTWLGSQSNLIFASTTPQIIDADTTAGLQYTIEISGNGRWSDSQDYAKNAYAFTGTKAECNTKFALLRFWPSKAASANPLVASGFCNFRLFKNQTRIVNTNIFLTGTAQAYTAPTETNILTAVNFGSGTFRPTVTQVLYASLYDTLTVGGGGGGGMGGGGGGGVLSAENLNINNLGLNSTTGIPNGFLVSPAPEQQSPSFNNRGLDGFSSQGPNGTAPGGFGGQRVKASVNVAGRNYNGGASGVNAGGTGITSAISDIGAGGGGAGRGTGAVGSNATGAGTTLTGGAGGGGVSTWYGTVGSGGGGGVLKLNASNQIVNTAGSNGSSIGGGGGGAYGAYQGTNSTPGNGRPGIVVIRIRA